MDRHLVKASMILTQIYKHKIRMMNGSFRLMFAVDLLDEEHFSWMCRAYCLAQIHGLWNKLQGIPWIPGDMLVWIRLM